MKKNNCYTVQYLSLGLLEGRQSYNGTFQSSQENIQHFKNVILTLFFLFLWVIFFSLLDQDHADQTIAYPDPQHWKQPLT